MSSPLLTIASLVLVLVLCVGVVLLGRAVRARVTGDVKPTPSRHGKAGRRDWAVTPLPTGLARTLTQRGVVNAEQLASMSPAEREFFVNTVAARLGETGKPRLVDASPGGDRAPSATPATGATAVAPPPRRHGVTPAASAAIPADPPLSGALISGVIHCPVCRTPLGERAETPLLVARCPGCARRIAARVDGDRLTLTVDYGARLTPQASPPQPH
jgi:hypothetical protein